MDISIEKIYDSRTRKYFEEVLCCYENGSYRAAIVLLNSVCLSDLFYKLQELRDVYSDKSAFDIIADIEKNISQDKTSPGWEKTLVKNVFEKTQLLDSAGYTSLLHLHDYRNLTAHPVLDGSYYLYSPSKELVKSCINEVYNSILTKPSFFVKNIVQFMSDDIDSKKRYIMRNKEDFKEYIEQKYLIHMSEPMIIKVFQAFWKFVFVLNNEKCDENRLVNMNLIQLLLRKYYSQITKDLYNNMEKYELSDKEITIKYMFVLLACHPELYHLLHKNVQNLISLNIDSDDFYKFISWFKYETKQHHIQMLIDEGYTYLPYDLDKKRFITKIFEETGETDVLLEYYVHVVRKAETFSSVISIMTGFILSNIPRMKKELLEKLISAINENSQIYRNYNLNSYCEKVWKYAESHFRKAYIEIKYPKFVIP